MILYHGSIQEVKEPELLKAKRTLDFGEGFYTTSDLKQATDWAKRKASIYKQDKSYVTVYEIDDSEFEKMNILKFEKADETWLDFVSNSRKGKDIDESYDVIYGPVANDKTAPVIDAYMDGAYDKEEAIKRLLPQNLKDQYTFKTERAISLLKYKETIING